jgi:hypothetical protein
VQRARLALSIAAVGVMLVALFIAGSHGSGVALGQFVDPPAAIMVA